MTTFSGKHAHFGPLGPKEPLRECPHWPTMQWLPHEAIDLLAQHVEVLAAEGFTTTRSELIYAVILSCDPTELTLFEDLRTYKSRHHPVRSARERLRGVPLVLRMPSPISLRLDGLVKAISAAGQRTYRHEMIGTLITRAGDDYIRLEDDCLAYRRALAEDAAVPGQSPVAVLSQQKPRPGARSF